MGHISTFLVVLKLLDWYIMTITVCTGEILISHMMIFTVHVNMFSYRRLILTETVKFSRLGTMD